MIEKDDVFEVEDKLYCVFDVINYNGGEYCFCNEMENEKTFGAKYVIFENFDDGIERVYDEDLLNVLSPMFANNMNSEAYDEN